MAITGAFVLAACGDPADAPGNPLPSDHHTSVSASGSASPAPIPDVALRAGERFVTVALPEPYEPAAPNGIGTDDYRCFLLDPGLTSNSLVDGHLIEPQNAAIVHHVIAYTVSPDQVAQAQAKDAAEPGQGWTCFGGPGLGGGQGQRLDNAGWIGGWAPGGGERILPEDVGIPLAAGGLIVVQMHYNLLAGDGPDQSSIRLRVSDDDGTKRPLETMLLPASVELPCRLGVTGEMCDRAASVNDVKTRFGEQHATADLLPLLCGAPPIGQTQSCTREITEPTTLRAVSGHMHLLGRSIYIDVNKGTPEARRVLDIPVWDFDNQVAQALDSPISLTAGDSLTVTCRHDQSLRDRLPAFEGLPERYVVWGEGTTDEMCLGIVLVTRP
ncbi:MAG: hypothetical protein KBB39_15075 [Phycicoccus sp.]|nr:hypothetical protein [Phycicoccus sp.]